MTVLRLLLVPLLLLAAAAPARGDAARLLALGGDGSYLEDDRGVLRWYGSVLDHGAQAQLESGVFTSDGYPRARGLRTGGPALGGVAEVGRDTTRAVIGLWLADRAGALDPADLARDPLGRGLAFLAGHARGGLGLALAYRTADGAGDFEAGGQRISGLTRQDVGLGVRFGLGRGAYADLAGDWRIAGAETRAGSEPAVDRRTHGSWALRARAFAALSDDLVLVPLVAWVRDERPWTPDAAPVAEAWRAGAGLTWLPDPDRLVLLVLELRDADVPAAFPDAGDGTVAALRAAWELRAGAFWSVRGSAGVERDAAADRTLVPLAVGAAGHLGPLNLGLGLANHPPAAASGRRPPATADAWLTAAATWAF